MSKTRTRGRIPLGGRPLRAIAGIGSGLVRRQAAMIFGNGPSAPSAKAATRTIPIVFASGSDPVTDGLVASLNRPGGNVTGVSFTSGVSGAETTRAVAPARARSEDNCHAREPEHGGNRDGAERRAGRGACDRATTRVFLDANSDQDIEAAFATFIQRGAGALLVGTGAFLNSHRVGIVALATRQALPVVYPSPRVRRGRWPDELWNQYK